MEPSLHKALFAQKKFFEGIVVVEWRVFKYHDPGFIRLVGSGEGLNIEAPVIS